jgi:hypothetical protein
VEVARLPPTHLVAYAVFALLDRHDLLALGVPAQEAFTSVDDKLESGVGLQLLVSSDPLLEDEPKAQDDVSVGLQEGEKGGD